MTYKTNRTDMTDKTYKILLLLGALLMAGCSQEFEVEQEGSVAAVAISFECTADESYGTDDAYTRAANGYTGNITAENHQLRYAGFGTFMAHDNTSEPDIMCNQEVEYVFLADGSGDGYWTYSPLKYWPAQAVGVCFCAYAPYVDKPADDFKDDPDNTGIIGMSANDNPNPFILYARAKHPEENVDLLWCFHQVAAEDDFLGGDDHRPAMGSAVQIQMHHALARVRISVGITNGSTLAEGEKLLLKRLTLTGNFAKTGQLNLKQGPTGEPPVWTPDWSDQVLATPADAATYKTIFIDCNPEANPDSYGIIAEGARYISGLPVAWQPAGLPHLNYDAADDDLKDNKTNLLCMGDAPSYLYLIPQADLEFSCVLDFCRITSAGVETNFHKTTANTPPESTPTPIHITPLEGNKTYDLNLTITL